MEVDTEDRLEQLKKKALGDFEISAYLDGQTKILKYNELSHFSSIDQLLSPYDNVVILLETKYNLGHWICLKKTGNMISFFDSYGNFPDAQKRFVNTQFLIDSGQLFNILCKLLDNASYMYVIEFSDKMLQDINNREIATCGYWCCVFIKSGLTVDQFYKMIASHGEKDLDKLIIELFYNEPIKKKRRLI